MYALAHGALAIEKRLEALDVPKLDRATYHDAFGDPTLFREVLKPLLGSERTYPSSLMQGTNISWMSGYFPYAKECILVLSYGSL